ncbi:MAG: hypothetical protein U0325_15815 [Polyangiales bacterium]
MNTTTTKTSPAASTVLKVRTAVRAGFSLGCSNVGAQQVATRTQGYAMAELGL